MRLGNVANIKIMCVPSEMTAEDVIEAYPEYNYEKAKAKAKGKYKLILFLYDGFNKYLDEVSFEDLFRPEDMEMPKV